jgi:hypothetical protein
VPFVKGLREVLSVLASIMTTIVVLVVSLAAGVYAVFCVVHAINSSGMLGM